LSSESSSPELPEPELPVLPFESSTSSERPPPEPEAPVLPFDESSVVGSVVVAVVGLVVVVDPVPPDVDALPVVAPPAGLVVEETGPMNTPFTPSWCSGLQWSEPLRSSAETCEQVTVSMVPGVAATATPCGRNAAALVTTATATGRHTFCPNISGGPPDDLLIGPRVDIDASTTR
jgi:hypothetical protein